MPASKNKFLEPASYDLKIGKAKGGSKIGELRVKPSTILWRGKNQQQYRSVQLHEFTAWIEKHGKLVNQ